MCEVVRFYERWVNGTGLPLRQLVFGRAPKQALDPCSASPPQSAPIVLDLEPYTGLAPELPRLNADELAPVAHVVIHGSVATADACAFSDIDVAVILDDVHPYTPEQHRRAVLELRRLLHAVLRHDPLMHHGLMFFPLSGLEQYDERFLPVDALRCARVLHGPAALTLNAAQAPVEEFRASLRGSAAALRKRFETMEFVNDDYQLKNVLSGILLMPSRVLATRGVHVYKRDSFELARPLFTQPQWDLVARSEALRSTWMRPPAPSLHKYVPQPSHPHLRRVIGSRCAPRLNAQRLSQRMTENLRRSASAFLDRVEAIS